MNQSLAAQVFTTISQRFISRSHDIAGFTLTGYSFEEWLNWEAFCACREKADWIVSPKPGYSKICVEPTGDLGDLLITAKDSALPVLVEIAQVHDYTHPGKWREKIEWDTVKLSRKFVSPLETLQLVVLASSSKIQTSARWQEWLNSIKLWNRPSLAKIASELPSSGEIVVHGWFTGCEAWTSPR